MKKYTIYIAALVLMAITYGNSQPYFPSYDSYHSSKIDVAAKHYLVSLQSTNEGIVTSALAQIGRMKLYFPDRSFPELEKKVSDLAANGTTSNIRYRAFLVSNVCANPALFTAQAQMQYDDCDALFNAIAGQLNNSLLGANSSR